MKETNPKTLIRIDNLKSLYSNIKDDFFLENNKNISFTINSIKSPALAEFEKESTNIFFIPVSCQENYSGNYDNYIQSTLSHICSLRALPYEKILENENLHMNYPSDDIKNISNSNKKLLLLDLDETLIHSEYPISENNINKYDSILRFKNNNPDFEDNNEYCEVGIFIRNGVQKFLSLLNNYFNIGIFTASEKDYADAIISYLDPNKNIFKFCLYRYNCINVNNLVCIKDLRIIKNIDLKKTVLIDNNIYSFSLQLNNGILINSYYGEKNDNELNNVLCYLLQFILPADDVRKVNDNFFGFEKLCKKINE